jgi:hypothetical protein
MMINGKEFITQVVKGVSKKKDGTGLEDLQERLVWIALCMIVLLLCVNVYYISH